MVLVLMIIAKTENLLFQPKDLWWEFGSSGPANIKLVKIFSKFYKYLEYSGPENSEFVKDVLWKYQRYYVADTFALSSSSLDIMIAENQECWIW